MTSAMLAGPARLTEAGARLREQRSLIPPEARGSGAPAGSELLQLREGAARRAAELPPESPRLRGVPSDELTERQTGGGAARWSLAAVLV
jgi:hypothetical protein